MKSLRTVREIIVKNKSVIAERFNVKVIGVFGSYVRGAQQKNSDIDILVGFSETPDFFEFLRLEEFLNKLLGVKVDLVTRKALKPMLKNEILKEVIYI